MVQPSHSDDGLTPQNRGSKLDSWKEIAAYLNRDIRTVQRWERTAGLPVRRLQKPGLRAVFAYTADLDDWLQLQSNSTVSVVEPNVALESPTSFPIKTLAAGIVAIAGLLFFGGWWYFSEGRTKTGTDFRLSTSRPITSDPGSERDPDISPDGKYVAYSYVAPNLSTRILIRLIDGSTGPQPVTAATENEWSPVWSPNGTQIAFLRGDPSGEVSLHLTSAIGGGGVGAERQVASGLKPYPRRRTLLVGHLLAWMPDGLRVVVADRPSPTQGGLFLIHIETGARTKLTSPEVAQYDVEPTVSSDGRTLVFNRINGEFLSDVFVQKLDSGGLPDGPPRKLPAAGKWNGTPRLLESRGEVLVCAGSLPRLALWRQPLDGSRPPVSLGIIGDYATQSAVHNKSGRIVSRTYRSQADILRFGLPSGSVADSAPAVEPPVESFLESTFIDRSPTYAPDGSQIAFISDRTGKRQVWVSNAEGTVPVEWTQKFEVDMIAPAWSPDGSKLVFSGEGPRGTAQLYVADRNSRTAVRVTDDGLDHGRAVFSNDGQAIYVSAADKSVYSIYRIFGATPAEKIATGYSYVAGVEPSGRGLYAARSTGRNRSELEFIPLLPKPGPPVRIATLNFADDCWVAPDGIYYMARREDRPLAPVSLRFRPHSGAAERILQNFSKPPGRSISVSADRRFAVTMRVVPPISDLLLLETSLTAR
jgi:Tol biopolymer transport system component